MKGVKASNLVVSLLWAILPVLLVWLQGEGSELLIKLVGANGAAVLLNLIWKMYQVAAPGDEPTEPAQARALGGASSSTASRSWLRELLIG